MAEVTLTFLLQQLTEVIGYKDLISGAKSEIEKLIADLKSLKTSLNVAEEKKSKDDSLKALVTKIKEAVCEVEDAIDICLTDAIKIEHKNSLKSALSLASPKRSSLAKEVKAIRDEKVRPLLDEASYFANTQKIADGSVGGEDRSVESKRDTPIRQNKVVGFEDQEAIIIDYLLEKRDKLDVISIIGIPGQGKTTLAWKVYHNDHVGFEFPVRIWIYISQTFNCRDVFLQILGKFSPRENISSLKDEELAQTVRSCLEKEKFLLVLDDVWSVEVWNKIKEVFPLNNVKSKVLITSRDKRVGEISRIHHNLRFLNENESWTLLQYEVFNKLEAYSPELKDIGFQIAIKCEGVPLMIVVIGGILADQLNKSPSTAVEEWEMVVGNLSEALQNGGAERIKDVVELSYHRLLNGLTQCFVSLGIYPEDYEISAKKLCRLWISEGFIIPKNGNQSLEQSAEENLNELIYRNLLKAEKTNEMGKVKTCRVHVMIRAFCIAKSKGENSFQEITRSKTGEFKPPLSEVKSSHRLCLRSDISNFLSERPSGPHVGSFLCFYDQPGKLESEYTSVIPKSFPKLRILEFECVKFDKFPQKFTELIHLRYLTLYIDTLQDLPESITLLWNLQSLVVETESRTITVKANMWRMIRLRYLKTKAAFVLDNKKWTGDAGENLHTLSRLAPESCTEAVAKKVKNLRILGISGKLTNIFKTKFLENLHFLEKLKLVNSLAYEQTSEDVLPGLPPRNCFPPNLKRLTLSNTSLSWQNISTLAMIRSLEVLKLRDNAFVGVSWNLGGDNFPNLQLLHFVNITEVVLWEAPANAFPKLRFLVVRNCENLKEIPESMGEKLEKLEIERVRSSAVKSAQKIEEVKMAKPNGVRFKLIIGPGCGIN